MVLLDFGCSIRNEFSHCGSHFKYCGRTSTIIGSNKFIMIEMKEQHHHNWISIWCLLLNLGKWLAHFSRNDTQFIVKSGVQTNYHTTHWPLIDEFSKKVIVCITSTHFVYICCDNISWWIVINHPLNCIHYFIIQARCGTFLWRVNTVWDMPLKGLNYL